jgi:cytochrome c oxidase subunit III
MAEAHAKHHDYHLVDPSPWPLIGSASAFVMAVGGVMYLKSLTIGGLAIGPYVFFAGVIGVLYTMLSWWTDVAREATY